MLRTSVLRISRASRALAGAGHAGPAAAGSGSHHLPTAHRLRQSTNITGLDVHPSPLPTLVGVYESTLNLLKALPESSVYRQSAEAITQHRLDVVKRHLNTVGAGGAASSRSGSADEDAIEAVEREIDCGLIEEVVKQAKDEEGLAGKMIEWKSHEPLEHPAPRGQWSYFNMEEEAGEGDFNKV